jgi:hypothetical protein
MIRAFLFSFVLLLSCVAPQTARAQLVGEMPQKVQAYFDDVFSKLKTVADAQPTVANFRQVAQPVLKTVPGLFGGSYIDENWVIRQSLFAIHAMARGFDLKGVAELKYFQEKMKESPGPQLSEPGHGSIVQPRLIAMRYPVMKDGKVVGIASMMVRTEFFIRAVGLDKVKAFKIICLGKLAEQRGVMSAQFKEFKISLPSTEWTIQYEE